jgi:hypothetical protein
MRATGIKSSCRHRALAGNVVFMVNQVQDNVSVGQVQSSSEVKVAKATDYYKPLVEGDILESTNEQRAIVGVAYVCLALLAAKGVYLLDENDGSLLGAVAAFLIGFEFADFGSGVYHWSMDNYGNKDTPVFGTQIEAFQVNSLHDGVHHDGF